jgi:hypothetical protein
MTWGELKSRLNSLCTDETPVRIRAFGGIGRSGVDIAGASIGIDWDGGSTLLSPAKPLWRNRDATTPQLAGDEA